MNTYENHTYDDIRLPFIFSKKALTLTSSDPSNWHENIELIFVTGGKGMVFANDMNTSVSSGDIVIVNPNSLHTLTTTEVFEYYYLIVDRSFCLENHFDTNQLRFEPYIKDEKLFGLLDTLVAEYEKLSREPYTVQEIRATVLRIMSLVCRNYSCPDKSLHSDTGLMACIKQAIGYIHSESQRNITLDEISHFVGLSSYYFAREFKRITGYTFVSYLNLIRCENAKHLLSKKQSTIADISKMCGFTNSSYFTRTFKRYAGVLPTEYQQLNKSHKK